MKEKKQHVCFYLAYLSFKLSLGLAMKLKDRLYDRERDVIMKAERWQGQQPVNVSSDKLVFKSI